MQKQTKPEPLGASMAKLVLVAIIIASLGAVLGVLGYALTKPKLVIQNPPVVKEINETADWKTYRNEEYGFELKYPSNLLLEEKKDEQASWKSISVFMKSDDFNGYILVNNASMGTGFEISVSSEDIQIGNIKTKLEILDSFSDDNQRAAKVSFSKNSNEYFWLFRFDKNNSNRIKLSKEIYSTFKFIEK